MDNATQLQSICKGMEFYAAIGVLLSFSVIMHNTNDGVKIKKCELKIVNVFYFYVRRTYGWRPGDSGREKEEVKLMVGRICTKLCLTHVIFTIAKGTAQFCRQVVYCSSQCLYVFYRMYIWKDEFMPSPIISDLSRNLVLQVHSNLSILNVVGSKSNVI